jgi:hypothetical protein
MPTWNVVLTDLHEKIIGEAPLYVGECCKGAVTELATPVYWY